MAIIGHKTISLFDLWSLCHFFAGGATGNILIKLPNGLALQKNGVQQE